MRTTFDAFRSTASQSHHGDRSRVLIAEDYIDLANVIAMLLRHCGFDVKTVHDGRVVLSLVRSFRPRFILLDVKLPGLDGYEVAEQIREDGALADTIIIAISAYRLAQQPSLPRKTHFDHHLTKPFEWERLLKILTAS